MYLQVERYMLASGGHDKPTVQVVYTIRPWTAQLRARYWYTYLYVYTLYTYICIINTISTCIHKSVSYMCTVKNDL